MNEEIRFEVGEKYENMKGVFEVIAIHRDQMDIRWESGEEISTSIALQQRILERMQHEKELEAEKQVLKKKAKSSISKSRKPFDGLESGDFSLAVSKTSWRGRGQLGGSVAGKLSSKSFKFNSWAVLRKPEIHWLDIGRQKQKDLSLQAKFYARVDETTLFFGFHVPRLQPSTETGDWNRVIDWLQRAENEAWLLTQCIANELYIVDLSGDGINGRLVGEESQWIHCQNENSRQKVDSLAAFLSEAATNREIDLRIEKRLEKQAVIAKKETIAADMATLFGNLAPLYTAAAPSMP